MIHDPVSQTGFILEPDQKVARKLPAHGKGGPGADAAGDKKQRPEDSNVKKESLGTAKQSME